MLQLYNLLDFIIKARFLVEIFSIFFWKNNSYEKHSKIINIKLFVIVKNFYYQKYYLNKLDYIIIYKVLKIYIKLYKDEYKSFLTFWINFYIN